MRHVDYCNLGEGPRVARRVGPWKLSLTVIEGVRRGEDDMHALVRVVRDAVDAEALVQRVPIGLAQVDRYDRPHVQWEIDQRHACVYVCACACARACVLLPHTAKKGSCGGMAPNTFCKTFQNDERDGERQHICVDTPVARAPADTETFAPRRRLPHHAAHTLGDAARRRSVRPTLLRCAGAPQVGPCLCRTASSLCSRADVDYPVGAALAGTAVKAQHDAHEGRRRSSSSASVPRHRRVLALPTSDASLPAATRACWLPHGPWQRLLTG